jgi:hypothetical protein
VKRRNRQGTPTVQSIAPPQSTIVPSAAHSVPLQWDDDEHLQVGDAHFFLTIDPSTWNVNDSKADRFVLLKTRRMIESLFRFVPERIENVVDLGIFKGGSIALNQMLFSPKRMVGIDVKPRRVDALDRFIDRRRLNENVRLYYGTSQGDQERLTEIVQENFGEEPLDLVIDDCSHMYELCKASLNILFPRVRPGGLYVIEDWGWAHWSGDYWQGSGHPFVEERTPLSRLILELVMIAASRPGLISEVTIRHSAAYLTRGDEVVSGAPFDVSEAYLTGGRQILYEEPTPG